MVEYAVSVFHVYIQFYVSIFLTFKVAFNGRDKDGRRHPLKWTREDKLVHQPRVLQRIMVLRAWYSHKDCWDTFLSKDPSKFPLAKPLFFLKSRLSPPATTPSISTDDDDDAFHSGSELDESLPEGDVDADMDAAERAHLLGLQKERERLVARGKRPKPIGPAIRGAKRSAPKAKRPRKN